MRSATWWGEGAGRRRLGKIGLAVQIESWVLRGVLASRRGIPGNSAGAADMKKVVAASDRELWERVVGGERGQFRAVV
jgi:hypothetical protein